MACRRNWSKAVGMQHRQIPMNDHTDTPELPPPGTGRAEAPQGGVIESPARRKFARAGVAAPVVLGSLVSKPVLATGTGDRPPYHCTISGKMSGNFSAHPDTVNCKTLGRSPGYWKTHAGWPGGLTPGSLPKNDCSFYSSQPAGTYFDGLSVGGASFTNAFRRKSVSSVCEVIDRRQSAWSTTLGKATLLQVLSTGGGVNDTELKALGRATVASLLNSIAFAPTYPLTPAKVINMFNAVAPSGGKVQINATTWWDAAQVKAYFESLYGDV